MFTRVMRWVYIVFAWLFLATVVVQFYLAGFAVFSRERNFEVHMAFGFTIGGLSLLGLLLSFAARVPWATTGWRTLLFVQIGILQSLFAAYMVTLPAVAALHVINAVAIFTISAYLAVQARKLVSAPQRPAQERERVPVA